ncbi:MAG: translocation/assembly module TamB domain-containing protein [Acidobacteria bacterium]|nr:translocation/assembly module TamB domain-containing protein [Acidobacteriota bacterium]
MPGVRLVFPFLLLLAAAAGASCREDGEIQISSLRFRGVEQIEESALKGVLQTRAGSRLPWGRKRFFDRRAFEADLKRIEAFYLDRGFPDARVSSFDVALSQDQETVDITVTIAEGEPILYGLELFEFANIEALADARTQPPDVPVRVTVAEGDHQKITVGVGYGTEEQARARLRWDHVNFVGGARHAGFEGKWSSLDRGVRLDYLGGPPVRAGQSPAPEVPRAAFLDAVDLEIGVSVPSNLVLRGSDLRPANAPIDIGDLNVTVGGLVQVRKAPRERVRVIGEVNTVRGSYTFQGRRFDILRDGRIRFAGTEEIDPTIDLRARRVISGVETFVRLQGTMRQPELAFSSSPPLDQADILSLVVFNLPINELGEGQQISLAERAGALAGGYLVSGLTRSVANALELDAFEIQAQGERGLGPSLTLGEQVGERTYFRIRQGFGAEQTTELILEYQIADFLRVQGAVAETSGGTQRVTFRRIERAGLDLIFFFSY